MYNILVCTSELKNAISLYRVAGPFAHLRKQIPLNIETPDVFSWPIVRSADIAFFQCPMAASHLESIQLVKGCQVPVWIDMDDDVFNLPIENRAHDTYRDPKVRQTVEECLRLADIVTVATEPLKESLSQYNKNIRIIPNAFDESWLKEYNPIGKKLDPKIIMWRGSETHIKDLMTVSKQIINIAKAHNDVTFRFVGYLPWFLADRFPRDENAVKGFQHVQTMDPMRYMQFLKNSNHSITIVPLQDITFNRVKSNIAWQEATLAGSAVLAPNLPEWQKPGIITYSSPEDFESLLTSMICGDVDLGKNVRNSLDYILDNLTLGRINQQRKAIIEELTS